MKRVICPRCYNSSIQIVSGNTIIPIDFSSDDDENNSSNISKKVDTTPIKDEQIKLHKKNCILQCNVCGSSFSFKKKNK